MANLSPALLQNAFNECLQAFEPNKVSVFYSGGNEVYATVKFPGSNPLLSKKLTFTAYTDGRIDIEYTVPGGVSNALKLNSKYYAYFCCRGGKLQHSNILAKEDDVKLFMQCYAKLVLSPEFKQDVG